MIFFLSDLVKKITYLDAIFWLRNAIANLSEKTGPNFFKKAGYKFNSQMDESDEDDSISLANLRNLVVRADCTDLSIVEYVNVDTGVLTEYETQFTTSTESNVQSTENDDDLLMEDENDEQNTTVSTINIQHFEAKNMLKQVKQFACDKGLITLLEKTMEYIDLIENHGLPKQTKQSSITDYFSK